VLHTKHRETRERFQRADNNYQKSAHRAAQRCGYMRGYYETALRHIFMKMIKGAVHVARRAESRGLLLLDIAASSFDIFPS
jgi:hypothetical protein